MTIKKASPRLDLHFPADAIYRVADISGLSGNLDLQTIGTGYPRHAPQRTTLLGGGSAADAKFTTETGATITVTVPAGAIIVLDIPVKTLVKTGSGAVQTVHEWWTGSGAIQ